MRNSLHLIQVLGLQGWNKDDYKAVCTNPVRPFNYFVSVLYSVEYNVAFPMAGSPCNTFMCQNRHHNDAMFVGWNRFKVFFKMKFLHRLFRYLVSFSKEQNIMAFIFWNDRSLQICNRICSSLFLYLFVKRTMSPFVVNQPWLGRRILSSSVCACVIAVGKYITFPNRWVLASKWFYMWNKPKLIL